MGYVLCGGFKSKTHDIWSSFLLLRPSNIKGRRRQNVTEVGCIQSSSLMHSLTTSPIPPTIFRSVHLHYCHRVKFSTINSLKIHMYMN